MISWNATASGIVSLIPIVSGDGPRDDPIPTAVRNSILPTLSALDIDDGLTRPLIPVSDRLDGGLGIAILLPDVGVGICRVLFDKALADAGAEALSSFISENMSPSSAYLKKSSHAFIDSIKKYTRRQNSISSEIAIHGQVTYEYFLCGMLVPFF